METVLALLPRAKEQLDHAREELKKQTPNREIVVAHLDTAEALFDAMITALPIDVPDTLREER